MSISRSSYHSVPERNLIGDSGTVSTIITAQFGKEFGWLRLAPAGMRETTSLPSAESCKTGLMTQLLLGSLSWFGAFVRSRHDLGPVLVALRQQVGVLKRKNPRLPLRSSLLAGPPALLVEMGEPACGCEAEHRRGLASRRVPWVALPFTPPSRPTPKALADSWRCSRDRL